MMCETKNFYLWLLQIIGLLGLLALCLWLSLRPKEPAFTITDQFSMPVSGNNSASSPATFSYVLAVRNKNKESSIYYDAISLTFRYKQDLLGSNTIPPLEQGKDKNDDQVIHDVGTNPKVWKDFVKEISVNGTAKLNVDLVTAVRYKTWGIVSKHHGIKLKGVIPIGSDGKIAGKKKKEKKVKLHH